MDNFYHLQLVCRGSLDSLAPLTGIQSSYAVQCSPHLEQRSLPLQWFATWPNRLHLKYRRGLRTYGLILKFKYPILTSDGRSDCKWRRTVVESTIPIHQQVCTGTSLRISLAVSNSPESQLPWGLGEHYISPLWGLLVGVMWSVWGLRFYHLSAECSSTFWLVADWYK